MILTLRQTKNDPDVHDGYNEKDLYSNNNIITDIITITLYFEIIF
jgi:hypothetical protein